MRSGFGMPQFWLWFIVCVSTSLCIFVWSYPNRILKEGRKGYDYMDDRMKVRKATITWRPSIVHLTWEYLCIPLELGGYNQPLSFLGECSHIWVRWSCKPNRNQGHGLTRCCNNFEVIESNVLVNKWRNGVSWFSKVVKSFYNLVEQF